jgi:hypothetical protein
METIKMISYFLNIDKFMIHTECIMLENFKTIHATVTI